MTAPLYDLLVIGGGINGAGIARDAAGRGLKVILCEKGDLAEATSSSSTKLIHGGLRYLEFYEFRLVREALAERERLLRIAPHIIWPLRFVLPHDKGLRPAWLLHLGLLLYDHFSRLQTLPGTTRVNLRTSPLGSPLKARLTKGFVYSDCWVEDSRLVVLNAMDAAARGAEIRTHTAVVDGRRGDDGWEVTLQDTSTGASETIHATAIVNAAGPWVTHTLHDILHVVTSRSMRLIKGSHIVTRRLYDGDQAYILQNLDKRIIFVIPYERDYTLVGTTDVSYEGEPGPVAISTDEISYLCESLNRFFTKPIARSDVIWSYSGIRPLFDDAAASASAVTRDYVLDLTDHNDHMPVLSIFGGKITTYRRLVEHALDKLQPFLPKFGGPWTADQPLPGGNIANADFAGYLTMFRQRFPFLPADLSYRLARDYGTCAERIVGISKRMDELGETFGADLTRAEVDYLVQHEWSRSSQDILWRRSKLGLRLSKEDVARLDAYLECQLARTAGGERQ